ncbi:hypothetical protein D3C75_789910 [compost metagenome]
MRFGIRAFFAVEHIIRQDALQRFTQDAFFTVADGFNFPGNVEHILHQPVIAIRDTDFKPYTHAHPVLAVQQRRHEPGNIEVGHHAHLRLFAGLSVKLRNLSHCIAVTVAQIFQRTYPFTDFGRQ